MAKKILSILLALLMLLMSVSMVACGEDEPAPNPPSDTDAPATDAPGTDAPTDTESEATTDSESESTAPDSESDSAAAPDSESDSAAAPGGESDSAAAPDSESDNAEGPSGSEPSTTTPAGPTDSDAGDSDEDDPWGGEEDTYDQGEDLTDPDDSNGDAGEGEESQTTTLGDGYVDENILLTLPEADYAGKVFNVSLPNTEHSYQFDPDKITGNLETDAIYRWKKKIQDTYNTKIVHKNWNTDDYYGLASPEIMSGLSIYHIYGHYAFRISEFIMNGCFQDWNALGTQVDAKGTKYLDLSATRWDQKLNSEVTYNGKLLSLTGDLGVSKLQSAMATFVNLDLLDTYCDGMTSEDLYAIVDAGDWTFTEFKNIVKEIYEDDAQPGKSFGDVLGYYGNSGNQGDIWFPAFDREITARDEVNNTITATFMSDSTNVTVIEELRSFFWDSENVMYGFLLSGAVSSTQKFLDEELGFITTQFRDVYGENGFNNMTSFGVVPTPKYDDKQEVYRTKLNDRYTIWGLPTCLKDSERQFTAHITDALCAESSETLYYQYYEVLLKGRYSGDKETARMVDKVMEHPHFDTSIQFGTHIGAYTYLPRNLIADRNKAIQSTYDEAEQGLMATLQKIYDCYK